MSTQSGRHAPHLLPRPRLLGFALLALTLVSTPRGAANPLPRFTEEREAAALHFVKKNCPELLPFLEELQKTNQVQYEQQIREVFQVTEMLADLRDDPRRHEFELKLWKTENRALVLAARLGVTKDEKAAKQLEGQILDLVKELVDL